MTDPKLPPPPYPPPRFFYNRFWMRKLIRWGWSYVEAGLIAQDIAEKCYLAPYDIHIQVLREASEEYRDPDPSKALLVVLRRKKNKDPTRNRKSRCCRKTCKYWRRPRSRWFCSVRIRRLPDDMLRDLVCAARTRPRIASWFVTPGVRTRRTKW